MKLIYSILMAMYVFYLWIISVESLVGMLPKSIRTRAKLAIYTLEQGILAFAGSGPQEFVRMDIKSNDAEVRVRVHTF